MTTHADLDAAVFSKKERQIRSLRNRVGVLEIQNARLKAERDAARTEHADHIIDLEFEVARLKSTPQPASAGERSPAPVWLCATPHNP
jgi:hypothetical protein